MKNKKTRKFITRLPALSLFALVLLAGRVYAEDIGERTDQGTAMLASLQSEQGLVYLNARVWLSGQEANQQMTPDQLRERVLVQGERLFIDFSAISDKAERQQARKTMEQLAGISFVADWVLVSAYKGELLFTPLGSVDDPAFYQVMERVETLEGQEKRVIRSQTKPPAAEVGLPHVAFYLNVNRKISDAECTFPRSRNWSRGNRLFCDSPNISLIYRVNLMRSLQFGNTGSATPDAKIVRISLDEETAGAGIQLNEELDWAMTRSPHDVLDGWVRDYTTDAIAQDYSFSIEASNTKAAVLKSLPANLNSKYEHREVSGFEVGVTGGAEAGGGTPDKPEGPKGKLEASATFSQQRWLTYNTQDYRVERSTTSAQKISFSWVREQYATAQSLLSKETAPIWDKGYYVDHNRIQPLSYKGFVPNLDVIYKAIPDEQGSTEFKIDSSVNIRPIYTSAYAHFYVVFSHLSFQGFEDTDKRRVTASTSFKVDWNHPVFTGGRPVNLQLGGFDNRCLSADANHVLSAVTCDETSVSQSFIYDQYGRYVSAQDTRRCLDGNDLDQLQRCGLSLGQRWEWIKGEDAISNQSANQLLGHDKQTGTLALYDENGNPQDVSVRTLTSYTRIFGPLAKASR